MTPHATRLEHALDVFLAFRQHGGSDAELLASNPDIADLLEAMLDETPVPDGGARTVGEFKLLSEIGRGGSGVVYEARQPNLDRRVALKMLHGPYAGNPTALARFRREAQTLARLDHGGVVRVFDAGDAAGVAWLAMEFVEGESLAALLGRLRAEGGHRQDSLRRCIESVAEVADALHHAHAEGIVHRDVKPSNILLRADGRAVLTDFGLARDTDDHTLTQEGVVAGTPHYMSPEQITQRSSGIDARADVFSLGATLYECITLRRPFEGSTTELVLHRILNTDPPDPRRAVRRLPADLAAIVLRALEKEPARRYATAAQFAEDLRAFLELRPVVARRPSPVRRLTRWVRREPLRATLAFLLLAAVAVNAVFLLRLPDLRRGELARKEREYEAAVGAGMLARDMKDRDGSLRNTARAMELFPDRVEAVALHCMCVRHLDGPEPALAELDRRTASMPPDPDLEWLRVLLLRRCGRTAEADALQARLGEPSTPTSLWLAGVLRLDDEPTDADKRAALELVSLATRLAPNPRVLLHLQWAACAHVAKDPSACRESAASLLRLWPDHPAALHLAAVNLEDDDVARSAALQQRAFDLGLDDRYGLRNLASYLYKAGRHPDWIAPLRRELELHPDDGLRKSFLWMLASSGDRAMAKAEIERWLAEVPDQPLALQIAGQLAADEDTERARELLRRAVAQMPQDAGLLYDLAVVTDDARDFVECERLLRRVLELDPTHARAHNRLCGVLRDQGDAAGVRAELERWLEHESADGALWAELARSLATSGDAALLPKALHAFDRADALAGGKDPVVLEGKARVLEQMQCEPAAAVYRERARAARR